MLLTYGCKNWLLCARCALTATDQAGCLAFHAINVRTREGERCAGAGEGGCGKICWNSHDLLASARKLNRNPAIAISIHSFKHQRGHKAHARAGSLWCDGFPTVCCVCIHASPHQHALWYASLRIQCKLKLCGIPFLTFAGSGAHSTPRRNLSLN